MGIGRRRSVCCSFGSEVGRVGCFTVGGVCRCLCQRKLALGRLAGGPVGVEAGQLGWWQILVRLMQGWQSWIGVGCLGGMWGEG